MTIGTCYYANGDKYQGQYKDDKRDGKGNSYRLHLGIHYYSNGSKYSGNWKEDKINGHGKYH